MAAFLRPVIRNLRDLLAVAGLKFSLFVILTELNQYLNAKDFGTGLEPSERQRENQAWEALS